MSPNPLVGAMWQHGGMQALVQLCQVARLVLGTTRRHKLLLELTAGLAGDSDRPQTLTWKTGVRTESCAVLMSRWRAGWVPRLGLVPHTCTALYCILMAGEHSRPCSPALTTTAHSPSPQNWEFVFTQRWKHPLQQNLHSCPPPPPLIPPFCLLLRCWYWPGLLLQPDHQPGPTHWSHSHVGEAGL